MVGRLLLICLATVGDRSKPYFEQLIDPATGKPASVTKSKYMQQAIKTRQGVIDANKERMLLFKRELMVL